MNMRGVATRQLVGQPISQVFDIDVDDLPRFMRGRPNGERLLRAKNGLVLFASAIAPAMNIRSTADIAQHLPRPLRDLSFRDPAMEKLQARAVKLAAREIPILIQGETGSGKEYLARAIHDSCAAAGNFVAVNCAAIPEHLIESELFGYTPGAFTGASQKGKRGLIEEANGGSLFLDEIGDMPLALQSRLLRVLSESEIQPVGALKARTVRLRVISASHRDLAELVREGRFRQDLFYRLNAATLTLPALRDREDRGWLIDQMLHRLAKENGETYRIDQTARQMLLAHSWPGNLRELSNALRVAAALSEGGLISLDCLPEHLMAGADTEEAPDDQDALRHALGECGNNVSALARRLGVNRSTIHRRLKRLN
jgi:transcriptional regulator of acetoin/glycerol metabolism